LLPASFCGAFGYKPTSGFTEMRGSNILVPRLANIGLLARSVDDLALFASVFSPELSATLVPHRPQRLGFVGAPPWTCLEPDADAAFAKLRGQLPAHVEEIVLPSEFDAVEDITRGLLAAHLAHRFGAMPQPAQDGYCTPLRELIAAGRTMLAADYLALESAADRLAQAVDGLLADVDALITLSALGEATPASQPGSGAPCMAWSLAGLPTISLPLLRGAHGLPIGVQLVGGFGKDAMLLSIAAWLANAVPV
jgi:Asp-tRNA(Asn)/Glu-tRNA(Gln) amidotransferase A subunit family amidase